MRGHLTLERMTCNATALNKAGVFVRAITNEAVVPLSTSQSGPGFSWPLANYSARIDKVPKFEEMCDTPAGYPKYLDFFWKYNTSAQYNYQERPIPYQLTTTNVWEKSWSACMYGIGLGYYDGRRLTLSVAIPR